MSSSPDAQQRRDRHPDAADQNTHHVASHDSPKGSGGVGQVPGQVSFDDLPQVARTSDPGPCWASSRDTAGVRPRLLDDYMCTLAAAWPLGKTVSELQRRHGGEAANISRRLTDAYRLGLTRREGVRRSVKTGKWQTVHFATDRGVRHAAAVIARRAAS